CVILGRDDRVSAGPIGNAQAGTEVARIGHAVEHQQACRPFDAIEQRRQVERRQARFGDGDDALVAPARPQAIEPLGRHGDGAQAGLLGQPQKLAHAGILAVGGDVELADALRIATNAATDGMETMDDHLRGPRLPGRASLAAFPDFLRGLAAGPEALPALALSPPRRSASRAARALLAVSDLAGAAFRAGRRRASASPRRGFSTSSR